MEPDINNYNAFMVKKLLTGLVALVLWGCGSSGDEGGEGVIDSLFAPPTDSMMALVQSEWASRMPDASDARVVFKDTLEATDSLPPMVLSIVRHGSAGAWHYGALLHAQGMEKLPTLVYAHGGDEGVDLSEVSLVLRLAPALSGYALLVPAFRSESLSYGDSLWTAQGLPSPWDRDVDDLLGLLAATDSLALPGRRDSLYGIGFSRGGGVILLSAIRDSRFARVVNFFGPTDFLGDFGREECEAMWEGHPSGRPGVEALGDEVISPLQDGLMSMGEARLALLRRSPAYFASLLPPVQAHHGDADTVVPLAQSQALFDAIEAKGRYAQASALYIYAGAGHNPLRMIPPFSEANAIARSVAFLAAEGKDAVYALAWK